MSEFRKFVNSLVAKGVDEATGPVLSAFQSMAKRNDADAVVLSVGRDNPDSSDPTSVVVQHPNGETRTVWMGSRTLRKNDPVTVVGNRAF